MLYKVELTIEAEDAYIALNEQAQYRCDLGQEDHPVVIAFEELHGALTETLPTGLPMLAWPMAGNVLSDYWVLNLNTVTIIYVIDETKPAKTTVIVQTITRRKKDSSMRRWLSSTLDSGQMNPVLHKLGIEPPLYKVAVNSQRVH
jgi:hypothetical protein